MHFNRSFRKSKLGDQKYLFRKGKPVLDLVVSHHQVSLPGASSGEPNKRTLNFAGNDSAYSRFDKASVQAGKHAQSGGRPHVSGLANGVTGLLRNKWLVATNLLLLALVVGSAMAVVLEAHKVRSQVSTLAELQKDRDQMQSGWTRLVLEQNTLVALDRVEGLAKEKHGMDYPTPKQIVLVKQDDLNPVSTLASR